MTHPEVASNESRRSQSALRLVFLYYWNAVFHFRENGRCYPFCFYSPKSTTVGQIKTLCLLIPLASEIFRKAKYFTPGFRLKEVHFFIPQSFYSSVILTIRLKFKNRGHLIYLCSQNSTTKIVQPLIVCCGNTFVHRNDSHFSSSGDSFH